MSGISTEGKPIEFSATPHDAHLLTAAQERASLAEKIVKSQDSEARIAANNNWYAKAAEDAGVDLDEALLNDGQGGANTKDRQRFKEARQARKKLTELLAKPMRKQNFGKFLSTAGAKSSLLMEQEVTPYIVGSMKRGRDADVKLNKHGKPKRRRK